jgi:hypothetical protein
LVPLPHTDVEKKNVEHILIETVEYVKELRKQFDTFFRAAVKPTGVLDHLNPEQRAWAEKRKQTIMWRQGFSDSYWMTVPCWYASSWGAHSLTIYSSLSSICCLFIWALAMRKPFRGCVEVGLGVEIEREEIYGPVNVRVYECEKRAGYPRVVVGDGLLNHLADLESRCQDDLEGKHTRMTIQECRKLITKDHTDTNILDPMGMGVKSLSVPQHPEMIRRAYEFTVSQEESFCKSDSHLHKYYQDLRKYCESRLTLWGLNPL